MDRSPISALLAAAALAVGLAACGEKEEVINGADTAATATPGPAAEVAGDWTGRLTQKGIRPFEVAVRINPSGTARVAYTGIDCVGRWELGPVEPASGGNPSRFTFRETITSGAGGNCKETGDVTISAAGVGILAYEFAGGGVVSRGALTATDTDGLLPTFRRARGQG